MNTLRLPDLPFEVLGEVFVQYVQLDRSAWSALVLSSICSLWRRVAIDTPRVWGKVHIGFGLLYDETDIFLFTRRQNAKGRGIPSLCKGLSRPGDLRAWLERSGSVPLDIVLHRDPPHSEPLKRFGAMVDVIGDEGHRWRSISVPPLQFLPKRLDALFGPTPLLERVEFERGPQGNQVHLLLPSAPRLRVARLEAIIRLPDNHPMFSGLTSLTCIATWAQNRTASLSRLLALFEHSVNLQTLTLRYDFAPTGSERSDQAKVIHHKLRKLHILGNMAVDKLFSCLHLPGLTSLTLSDFPTIHPAVIHHSLITLMDRSKSPLTTLELLHLAAPTTLAQILSGMDLLVDLRLDSTQLKDVDIRALESRQVAPKLQSLAVQVKATPYDKPRITRRGLQSLLSRRAIQNVYFEREMLGELLDKI